MKLAPLIALFACVLAGCSRQEVTSNAIHSRRNDPSTDEIRAGIKQIEPFFKPMGKPEQFDWLQTNKEPGQTFDDYIESIPTIPTAERRVIYVQPLGKFSAEQTKIIKTTSDYIAAFFGLPVKSLPQKSLPAKLTKPDQRMIDYPEHRQIRSGYILETILQPGLPKDAAALIAFTNEDLYPDASMYFVFGQASLENRVGVWSLYRLKDRTGYDAFLGRTMKIAVHETGHMFSMRHCTKYECVMSGTNHLAETDRRPIDACPECMAKICWMMKEQPETRYKRLAGFSEKYGMKLELEDFTKKQTAVTGQSN